MHSLTFDGEVLHIDGQPALIQAGTLHYHCLPHPDLWGPVLERFRMAGLNAVTLPFPWAYHSPAAGLYDFTGVRDLRYLLDEVERVGLWLIPYPGPWIYGDVDAGGMPPWACQIPGFLPQCASDVPAGPSFTFLRYVREWWSRLFPFFAKRPNLLLLALTPGPCGQEPLTRYLNPLVELARSFGVEVPCAVPDRAPDPANNEEDSLWLRLDLAGREGSNPGRGVLVSVALDMSLTWDSESRELVTRALGTEHPRHRLAEVLARGMSMYTLAPAHAGARWGYWRRVSQCTAHGIAGLVLEGGTLAEAYFSTRRLALAAETLGENLSTSRPARMVYASDARYLRSAWLSQKATVAFLDASDAGPGETRLSLALGSEMLTTEPVPLLEKTARVLPLTWQLVGGTLLTTTLEPVLAMTVAGRRLLILNNPVGGDLLFSDDFRPRHARGPVRAQRTDAGLAVRFESGRVISLLLDGPEGPLQLLALAPHFAGRVWPLDDNWRSTPAYPATWNPAPEDPARGLVIGPEFVRPRKGGGYAYGVTEKGFGYRWGPWRGSDPHTWLAPITWRAPHAVALPDLEWEPPRPGAPEVWPEYDDTAWRYIAHRAPLAATAHDIHAGFVWYRGRFKGTADTLTLLCPHACDVFLNGEHVAALNAVPYGADIVPKTLPLPPQYLREENVLAMLVETCGEARAWEDVAEARGVLACTLNTGHPLLWRIRGGLSGEQMVQGFPGFADWALVPDDGSSAVTWHRALFDLALPETVACPLYLFVEHVPTKAYIFLNGQLVGHYWDGHSPQRRFWLPEGMLYRQGLNEIMIAQWTRGAQPGLGNVYLERGPLMQWHEQAGH